MERTLEPSPFPPSPFGLNFRTFEYWIFCNFIKVKYIHKKRTIICIWLTHFHRPNVPVYSASRPFQCGPSLARKTRALCILALETKYRASRFPGHVCQCLCPGEGTGEAKRVSSPRPGPKVHMLRQALARPSTLSPSFLDSINVLLFQAWLEAEGWVGRHPKQTRAAGEKRKFRGRKTEPIRTSCSMRACHQGWCGGLCPMHSGTIWEGRVQVEIWPPLS